MLQVPGPAGEGEQNRDDGDGRDHHHPLVPAPYVGSGADGPAGMRGIPPLCGKEQAEAKEVYLESDRCEGLARVVADEGDGERDQRDEHQCCDVDPEGRAVDLPEPVHLGMMGHPEGSEDEEREEVVVECGRLAGKHCRDGGVGGVVDACRDVEAEHQEGHGNGEYAVGERLHPRTRKVSVSTARCEPVLRESGRCSGLIRNEHLHPGDRDGITSRCGEPAPRGSGRPAEGGRPGNRR
ncbi:MAG: hypothetical protein PWR21_545 [Methanoculleus sp.]|nr:hypothetical protein [Methanoculleus sp.]MDK2989087.1 hypothetical protein [Methanoculleus sp.]